jgi:Co/Zn/Cd efflux system component
LERKKWLSLIAEETGVFLVSLVAFLYANNLPQPQTTVWVSRDILSSILTTVFIMAMVCAMLLVAIHYWLSEPKKEVV